MLGRTHELAAVGAVTSAAILIPIQELNAETAIVSFLVAFVGGLTPDLDKRGSKIWDNIPAGGCLSRIISPLFIGGHRHLTHSLLGLAIFGLLFRLMLGVLPLGELIDINIVTASFMIAFASHIVADMFTKEGVPIFFPIPIHVGLPPFEFLRMRTNGLAENLLVTPAIILTVIAIAYSYKENTMALLKLVGLE